MRIVSAACAAAAIAVLLTFPLAILLHGSEATASPLGLSLGSYSAVSTFVMHGDGRSVPMAHGLGPHAVPRAASSPSSPALLAPPTLAGTNVSSSVWFLLSCPRCHTRTDITSACHVRPPALGSKAAADDLRRSLLASDRSLRDSLCVAHAYLNDDSQDGELVLSWGCGRRQSLRPQALLPPPLRDGRTVRLDEAEDSLDGFEGVEP